MFIKLKDIKGKPYTINIRYIEYISPRNNIAKQSQTDVITVKMHGDYAISISVEQWAKIKSFLPIDRLIMADA